MEVESKQLLSVADPLASWSTQSRDHFARRVVRQIGQARGYEMTACEACGTLGRAFLSVACRLADFGIYALVQVVDHFYKSVQVRRGSIHVLAERLL